jgi:hypothetical protein
MGRRNISVYYLVITHTFSVVTLKTCMNRNVEVRYY